MIDLTHSDELRMRKVALSRLRRRHVIRKEFRDGITTWWFEDPYFEVSDVVMSTITNSKYWRYRLVALGDSLFGVEHSQSWQAERAI